MAREKFINGDFIIDLRSSYQYNNFRNFHLSLTIYLIVNMTRPAATPKNI